MLSANETRNYHGDTDWNKWVKINTWIIDQREGTDTTAFFDIILQVLVRHSVENVLNVANHEILDENIVGSY